MPAGYAHLQFGHDVIKHLDHDKMKTIILDNIDLFHIGLHGPDIFFYHRPYYPQDKINNIGKNMHHEKAYHFFEFAKKKINDDAHLAYILGFICHFILDSQLHGFIDHIICETKIGHFEIEAEYDRRFMIKNNDDPLKTRLYDHIIVNQNTVCTIQSFFPKLSCLEIEKTLQDIHFYDHLLNAKNPIKRRFIYTCFLKTPFKGLVMNYHINHKLDPYYSKFDQKYDLSIQEACQFMKEYIDKYQTDEPLSQRFHHDYE